MKKISNYIYVLLALSILTIAACSKQAVKVSAIPNTLVPQGTFIGKFTLIHKNPKTSVLDTSSAIISLVMAPGYNYSVGGDTTKIQAPSNGTFTLDDANGLITFQDVLVTKVTPPNTPKKHLNGTFIYTYDGTLLHIYGASDTLSYNYTLN